MDDDSWDSDSGSSRTTADSDVVDMDLEDHSSDYVYVASSSDEETMPTTTSEEEEEENLSIEMEKPPNPEAPPPATTKGIEQPSQRSAEEEDGEICTICFENWTNAGDHRLSSLRCGHLFGFTCIRQWLTGKTQRCPQCNARAKRSDIRILYVNSLKVVDTTQQEQLVKELEREREARRKAEIETAHTRLKYQLAENELTRLKQMLDEQKRNVETNRGSLPSRLGLKLEKIVNVCTRNGCRVIAHHHSLDKLVISKAVSAERFGFAVLDVATLALSKIVIICHTKPVRDLSVSSLRQDGLLLTASMDKSVCLTNILTNSTTQRYSAQVPIWSCTWSRDHAEQFFAGLQNGSILQFDIRQTKTHVLQIPSECRSPVVSLQSVVHQPNASFSPGGLLSGQLTQATFHEFKGVEFTPHILPLEGSLTSLSFEHRTRQLLASFRPSSKNRHTTHLLCELTSNNTSTIPTIINNVCSCNIVHTFEGGSTQIQLSRSSLIPNMMNNGVLACASIENEGALVMWDVGTTEMADKVSLPSTALDVCSVSNGEQTALIACLTASSVHLFSNGKS